MSRPISNLEIGRRATLMREMPLYQRLAAIASADNVVDARMRFCPPRVVISDEDCA